VGEKERYNRHRRILQISVAPRSVIKQRKFSTAIVAEASRRKDRVQASNKGKEETRRRERERERERERINIVT
jgi:hypothetical protein